VGARRSGRGAAACMDVHGPSMASREAASASPIGVTPLVLSVLALICTPVNIPSEALTIFLAPR
jgi:hypothetical protein